jgi:predicted PurR-regulated permease PerM
LFSFLLSYFIVSETEGRTERVFHLDIPGYAYDVKRLMIELNNIWNAFLRGQLVVFLLVTTAYMVIYSVLGVQFFYGLALLAGLGRFIPYLGQWVAWGVALLVAFSQGYTLFGLDPGSYVLVVFATGVLTDSLIDNFITPRIFSTALKIHPAAVMVTAIVALNAIGIVGVILAAPVLATGKLVVDYLFNKMLDQNPWAHFVHASPQHFRTSLREGVNAIWSFVKRLSIQIYQWLSQRLHSAFGRR